VALHGNGPANDQGVQAAPRLTGVTPAPFRVENQANEGATASIVVVVHTDAAAAARHIATNPAKANVETLSDDELLELLAATGRPAGIVRVRGEAHVAEIAPVAGVVTPDPGAPAPPGARRGGPGQVQRLS
jgi:hypothetical protein